MKVYCIPPLSALEMMHLGDSYFCLAHLYLEYPHYKKFFKSLLRTTTTVVTSCTCGTSSTVSSCSTCIPYITLDNSAAERSLVTEDKLLDIVEELEPDEVIAPDILFDKDQTLKNLSSFANKMRARGLMNKTKLFGCPQGTTQEEWLECYKIMLKDPDVSTIGLSKISVPKCWLGLTKDQGIMEARNKCVDYLLKHDLIKKPIHCLGQGDPAEFKRYSKSNLTWKQKMLQFLRIRNYDDLKFIRSTDSCYPILAAKHGIEYFNNSFKRIETNNNYFLTTLDSGEKEIAKRNIEFLKRCCK